MENNGIPKGHLGTRPQHPSQKLSVEVAPQKQASSPQISREPVDYSAIPTSRSVEKEQKGIHYSDDDVLRVVRNVLAEQQKPIPSGSKSQQNLSAFQSDIAKTVHTSGYPMPRALAAPAT